MSDAQRGTWGVEVRPSTDPAGRPCVLLQLPHGYVLIPDPDAVREIALMLMIAAADFLPSETGATDV